MGGVFEVRHSEFLPPINGSATNASTGFDLHPSTFPWLSSLNGFGKYRFTGFRATWVPTVPTTEPGTIAIGFQTATTANAPGTVEDVMTWEGASAFPVWTNDVAATRADYDARYAAEHWYLVDGPNLQIDSVMWVVVDHTRINGQAVGRVKIDYICQFAQTRAPAAAKKAAAQAVLRTQVQRRAADNDVPHGLTGPALDALRALDDRGLLAGDADEEEAALPQAQVAPDVAVNV
jgi:hypothetical protein